MSAFNLSIWRGELGREEEEEEGEGEEGRVKYICAVQLCVVVHITLNSFYQRMESRPL